MNIVKYYSKKLEIMDYANGKASFEGRKSCEIWFMMEL